MLLRPPYLPDENQHENDNLSHLHSESDARKSNRSKGKPKKKQNSLSLRNKHQEKRQKPQATDRSYERENDTGSVASHASGKSKKNKKKESSLGGNKPRHMPIMNNSFSREQSSPEPIDYKSNFNEQSEVKQLGLISSPQSKYEQPKNQPSKYQIQNFEDDEDDLPVVKLSEDYSAHQNGKGKFYQERLSPKMAERKETRRLGKLFEESRSRNLENTSQGGSQLGGSFLNNSSAVGESRRSRSKLGQLFKEKSREKDSGYNNSRVDFTQNNSSVNFESSMQNLQLREQSHIQPGPKGINFREALNQVGNSKSRSTSREKPKINENSMKPKILQESVQQFHHDDKSDLNLSQSNQFNSRLKSRAQPSESFNKQSLCFTIEPEKNQNKRKSGLRVTSKLPDQKDNLHSINGNLISKDIEGNMVGINGNLTSKTIQSHQRLQNNLLENEKYLIESGLINNSPDDKQEQLRRKQEELRRREEQMERQRRAIQERNAQYEKQKAEQQKRRRQSIERQRQLYREQLQRRNKEDTERRIREEQASQKRLEDEKLARQREARDENQRRKKEKQEKEMKIKEEKRLREQQIQRERQRQLQKEKQLEKEKIRLREKQRLMEIEREKQKQKEIQKKRQNEKERQAEKRRYRQEKQEKERKMNEQSQKASTQTELKFESLERLPSSYSRVQSSVGDGDSERSVSSKKHAKKKKQSAIPMKKKTKVVVELSPRGEDSFYDDDVRSNEEPTKLSQPVFENKAGQGPKNILSFEDDGLFSGEEKIKSKTDTMFYDPSVSGKAPSSKPPLSRKSASSKSRPKQSSLTKKGDRKSENVVIKKNLQKADPSKNNQGSKKLSLIELAMQKEYQPRSQSGSSYRSQQSFRSNDYSGSVQSRGSYNSRNSKRSSKKQSTVHIKAKQNSALLPNRPPSYRKLSPENNLANRTVSHQRQMQQAEREHSKRIKQESRTIVSKDVCFIDQKGRLVRKDIIIKGNKVESGRESSFDENKILNRMRQSREKRKERSRERSMERSRMSSTERSLEKNRGNFSQTDSFLPHHRTDTNFVESEAYSQEDSGAEDYQYNGRLTGFSSAYDGFQNQKRSSNYYNESRNYPPSQNSYNKNSNNSINYLKEFIKPVEEAGINQMQTPSRNSRFEQNPSHKRVLQRTQRSAKKRY